MRVYCKCLNVEVTAYTSENKARPWKTIAVEADDDELPQSIDHESFQGDVFHFIAKAANEMVVRQDDIINRRKRIQEEKDYHSTLAVHAYLPHLILTHRRPNWRVRECFLCRTPVMACLHRGLSTACPAGLFGTSTEDNLFAILNAGSARLWMLSRDALTAAPHLSLTGSALHSLDARQRIETMNQVWRVAQSRAQAELEQRLEALRRQELAAYEEDARLAKEMQHQVANAYYGLLSMLPTEPNAFVEAEEEEKEKRKEEEEKRRKKALKEETDGFRVNNLRTERQPSTPAGGDDVSFPTAPDEVEMATEALDLYEADLFDDGPRLGGPSEDGDNDDSYVSEVSAQEEGENGEERRQRGGVEASETKTEESEEDDEEAYLENLSTSAISSSIQARAGMRTNVQSRDDRLPDADEFNAMTDAERTYAIEKASYQMQDNRLHEIYGDMEPPFLQELRRQAERTRHNPVASLEEKMTTERRGSPL